MEVEFKTKHVKIDIYYKKCDADYTGHIFYLENRSTFIVNIMCININMDQDALLEEVFNIE